MMHISVFPERKSAPAGDEKGFSTSRHENAHTKRLEISNTRTGDETSDRLVLKRRYHLEAIRQFM